MRRIVADFVDHYNSVRLHMVGGGRRSTGGEAIGDVAPKDKLEGRAQAILAERDRKLAAARQARKAKRT